MKPTCLQHGILATQEDMWLPVVSFDEVVLQKDLVHSHNQHSVDIIFYPNTWQHGELSRLILAIRGNNIKMQFKSEF